MLTVRMYKNFAKRTNSTLQPDSNVAYTDFSCSLKDNCTVLSPVVDIYLAAGDPAALGYNYAYIEAYSRYYFIDEWTYNLGVWTAEMSVDVLASYKARIGVFNAFVLRSASLVNDDIIDSFYPAVEDWKMTESNFSSLFDPSAGSFVVGIICPPALDAQTGDIRPNTRGSIGYYKATDKDVVKMIRYLMSDTFVDRLKDVTVGITESAVKNFVDPLQYIESIRWYPFDVAGGSTLPSVKPQVGWYDMTSETAFPSLGRMSSLVYTGTSSASIPVNPWSTATGKSFLNNSPYIQYELLFEPWGNIALDTSMMKGYSTLYMTVDIDLPTGMSRMSLGTSSGSSNLGVHNAVVGVNIPLAQITQDVMGATASLAGGVAGAVGSALTGNFGGAISNAVSGVKSATEALKPSASTKGSSDSFIAYYGSNKGPTLRLKYTNCTGVDVAEFGRPYCGTVASMPAGYNLCANGDIVLPCLSPERDLISSYLTGGFFYE